MIIKMLRDYAFQVEDWNGDPNTLVTLKEGLQLECLKVEWESTWGGFWYWSLRIDLNESFINNDKVEIRYLTEEAKEEMMSSLDTEWYITIDSTEEEKDKWFIEMQSQKDVVKEEKTYMDADEIISMFEEELKLMRKLQKEYWKDTEEAKDGIVDLEMSFEEWSREYVCDSLMRNHNVIDTEYVKKEVKKEIREGVKSYLENMM